MKIGNVTTVPDDLGNQWIVEPTDPGREAFKAARDLGLKDPIYPHEVLMGRPPAEARWDEFAELVMAKGFPAEDLRRIYCANLIRKHLRKQWTKATKI